MIIRCESIISPLNRSAVALGTFDGVHTGHAEVLRRTAAAKASGLTPRALTFPDLPGDFLETRTRAPRIMSNPLRERAILACGVEDICYFDLKNGGFEYTAEEFVDRIIISGLNAAEVFCGFNFRFGRGGAADAEQLKRLLEARGTELTVIEPVMLGGEPVSSSRIRRLVSEGNVREAAEALGRPYETDFVVEHGKQLGRSIGFPTINRRFPEGRLIPGFGVYATRTLLDGEWHGSVTNVGTRPTVGGQEVNEETYIFDAEGELYGRTIEVGYIDRIRSERYFENLQELRNRIEKDVAEARRILDVATAGRQVYNKK